MVSRGPIIGRRIRIALVGCGRIAQKHFEAIASHGERLELVAVCDIDPTALAAAIRRTHARGFESLDQLLAASDADVVALCTPSGLHPAQTVQIAAAGRHVVTEKPMATRWLDGKRMVEACDAANVRLFSI